MKNIKTLFLTAASGLVLLSSFTPAFSDTTATLKELSMGPCETAYIEYKMPGMSSYKKENVYVGVQKVQVTVNNATSVQNMLCVDLFQSSPNYSWTATLESSGTPYSWISSTAWDRATYLVDNYLNMPSLTNAQGAQLQSLVWEIIMDDPTSLNNYLSGGNFQLDYMPSWAKSSDYAQMWQTALSAPVGYGNGHYWYYSKDYQDLVLVGNTPAVPEIPAALLAPVGLAVLGCIKRKTAK